MASRALERRPRGRSVVGERAASGPVARHAARRGASAGGRVAGTAATSRRGGHVLRCGPLAQTMWRRGDGTGAGRVRGVPRGVRGACMHPWMAAAPTYARADQHLKTRSVVPALGLRVACERRPGPSVSLSPLSSLQTESTVQTRTRLSLAGQSYLRVARTVSSASYNTTQDLCVPCLCVPHSLSFNLPQYQKLAFFFIALRSRRGSNVLRVALRKNPSRSSRVSSNLSKQYSNGLYNLY